MEYILARYKNSRNNLLANYVALDLSSLESRPVDALVLESFFTFVYGIGIAECYLEMVLGFIRWQ